jgi:hypothetical protein
MATKAHKFTLSILLASHKITTQRSFNEIHSGSLALAMDCTSSTLTCITLDYFSKGALNERSMDSNWGVVAAKDHFIIIFSFLSSFLSRYYFL